MEWHLRWNIPYNCTSILRCTDQVSFDDPLHTRSVSSYISGPGFSMYVPLTHQSQSVLDRNIYFPTVSVLLRNDAGCLYSKFRFLFTHLSVQSTDIYNHRPWNLDSVFTVFVSRTPQPSIPLSSFGDWVLTRCPGDFWTQEPGSTRYSNITSTVL